MTMKRHITSFLKAPIGYVANLIATLDAHGVTLLPDAWQCWLCETFCAKDGIQDDCMW